MKGHFGMSQDDSSFAPAILGLPAAYLLRLRPLAVLRYAGLEPFLDQAHETSTKAQRTLFALREVLFGQLL